MMTTTQIAASRLYLCAHTKYYQEEEEVKKKKIKEEKRQQGVFQY